MNGHVISTASDFPNLEVVLRVANEKPVLSVAFRNPEFSSWRYGLALMLALPGWPMILGITLPVLIPAARDAGIHWTVPVAGVLAVIGLLVVWLMPPARVRRAIELDYGRDEFRVLRSGRTVLSRRLSRLASLTVEPHPQAEIEHRKRGGKLGPFQKQHCLFGFFGAAGAEKVLLLKRWEWPNQDSLYEVRQAVVWAKSIGDAGPEGLGFAPASDTPAAVPAGGRSIKPPLD